MTSINDQWKFQEATIRAMRKSMSNGNQQTMIKRMIASERSQPTGQRARPILNFTIATQGGQPRDYDQQIYEREFAIEKENVAVENDRLNGTQEMAPIAFDFKLSHQIKQTLLKEINELIKESQYIFSGDVNVIKFVDVFQKFNDLSFSYNEYISDIIRDVEFAQLWHTKLINLESIFERIAQRLKDIDAGRYSGSDSVKTTGAYSIPYLLEIIIQAKKVIEMMLLNKNTTQYLSIATAPQPTYITEGQIESSPQDELNTGYDPEEEQRQKDEQMRQDEEEKRLRKAEEKRQRRDEEWQHQERRDENKRREKAEYRLNKQKGILEQQAMKDVDRETDTDEERAARIERQAKIAAEQEQIRIELEALQKAREEGEDKRYALSQEVEIAELVKREFFDELQAHILKEKPTDKGELEKFMEERQTLTAQYNRAEREAGKARQRLQDFDDGKEVSNELPEKSEDGKIDEKGRSEEGETEAKHNEGEEEDGEEVIPETGPLDYKSAATALADHYRKNPTASSNDYYVFLRDHIGPFFYGDSITPADIKRIKSDRGQLKISKLTSTPVNKKGTGARNPTFFFEAYKEALGSKTGAYINPITPEIIEKLSNAYSFPNTSVTDFREQATAALITDNK